VENLKSNNFCGFPGEDAFSKKPKFYPPSLAFFYQIQVVLEEQLTGNKGRRLKRAASK